MKCKKVKLLGIILLASLLFTPPAQAQIIDPSQLEYNVIKGDSMTYKITSENLANDTYIQDDFMYANRSTFAYNITQGIIYESTIINVNYSKKFSEEIFVQERMTIPGKGVYNTGTYYFPITNSYSVPLSILELFFFNSFIPVSSIKNTMLKYFSFGLVRTGPVFLPVFHNNASSDVVLTSSSITLTFTWQSDDLNGPMKQITSYDLHTGWLESSNITFGDTGRTSNILIKHISTNLFSEVRNLTIQFSNFEGPILVLAVIVIVNIKMRKFRELQGNNDQNSSLRNFVKQEAKRILKKPQPKIHTEEIIRQVEEILKENEE